MPISPCKLLVAGRFSKSDWQFVHQLSHRCKVMLLSDERPPPEYQLAGAEIFSDESSSSISFQRRLDDPAILAVLHVGPLFTLAAFRFWWRKRLANPDRLFLILDLGNFPASRRLRAFSFLVRHDLLDGAIVAPSREQLNQVAPPGVFEVSAPTMAVEALSWIKQKAIARKKTLLWVDPSITQRSPAMRSLVLSVPKLKESGWQLRLWCNTTDISTETTNLTYLPSIPGPSAIQLFGFFFVCNLYASVRRWITGRKPATVIQTTCGYLLSADICAIHFCNPFWIHIAKELGSLSFREHLQLFVHRVGSLFEKWQLDSSSLKLLLPVSQGIGDATRRYYGDRVQQIILPNDYDQVRFNPEIRARHRETVRKQLQLENEETIFAFASYGHYRRKGFWLLVEAIKNLAAERVKNIKVLVIGGTPTTLARLKRSLTVAFPEWPQWFLLVGFQKEIERYLAAADAFLAPSYFEAACRTEIEAAALGLPLLLTPHCGTELFPRENIRGAWMEFNGADIARKMRTFAQDRDLSPPISLGGALTPEEYARRLNEIYENVRRGIQGEEYFCGNRLPVVSNQLSNSE